MRLKGFVLCRADHDQLTKDAIGTNV
jgi:hypothetical protein